MNSYINLYLSRLVVCYLRRQPFVLNPVIENPDAWIPPEQIHKHFEKPIRGEDEGGVSIAQRKTPLIEVKCETATACAPRFMGNWDAQLEVSVINSTDFDNDETHESRVNDVLALFYRDELVEELNAIQPFFCPRVIPLSINDHVEGISFVTQASFKFLSCCAQPLYAPE